MTYGDLIRAPSKLHKRDSLVILRRAAHTAPLHRGRLLESTQTDEIICMFSLARLCVDWQTLCLSYFAPMFACRRKGKKMLRLFVLQSKSTTRNQRGRVDVRSCRTVVNSPRLQFYILIKLHFWFDSTWVLFCRFLSITMLHLFNSCKPDLRELNTLSILFLKDGSLN